MNGIFAMGVRIALAALVAILLILAPSSPARAQDLNSERPGLDILYTGKRRSNLEPCGCKRTEQSGLQYEASIYEQYATT